MEEQPCSVCGLIGPPHRAIIPRPSPDGYARCAARNTRGEATVPIESGAPYLGVVLGQGRWKVLGAWGSTVSLLTALIAVLFASANCQRCFLPEQLNDSGTAPDQQGWLWLDLFCEALLPAACRNELW